MARGNETGLAQRDGGMGPAREAASVPRHVAAPNPRRRSLPGRLAGPLSLLEGELFPDGNGGDTICFVNR